jgi:nucleotide-binding universal stress UspA family protein
MTARVEGASARGHDTGMADFAPRSILVTTDLSAASMQAYPAARSLALAFQATVTLLTCIDISMHLYEGSAALELPSEYLPEALEGARRSTEEALKAHLLQHFSGMQARHELREAARPVHHTILEFIQQSDVDLVVTASHGRTGFSRVLVGSVAEQIVRLSRRPTLIIPTI